MKKAISILGIVLCSTLAFAQKNQIAFYAGLEMQPALTKYKPAISVNGRSYIDEHWSFGASISYTTEKHNQNFGYRAYRTRSNHTTINFLAQNDLIRNETLFLSAFVSSGLYRLILVNPDEYTLEETYSEIDGVWHVYQEEVPRKLQRDLYFNLQTGLDFSVKLATVPNQDFSIYLTSRASYQFVPGKKDLSKNNQFSQPIISIGVTLKGYK